MDTLPHVKVKKTDNPTGEQQVETSLDLADPENLKYDVGEYDEKSGYYKVGTKLGDNFLSAPTLMTPEEYATWNTRKLLSDYFKMRNDSLFVHKGKEKFDFTDMHFDLGPAEKIFGPGGVRIRTNGSAGLKAGINYKFTDNPTISERNRKTTNFDFDETVQLDVTASIGDKMNFSLGYGTEATFNYDAKKLKLVYEGQEDEIIKKLEAGNISFPSNNSLVHGAQALFGIHTDLQFGKLSLQTVISQKKSQSSAVGTRGGVQLDTFMIDVSNYEENMHFFLAQYFRDNYNKACATLPTVTSGVTINRVEIWVTNTSGITENTRNIIGFVDLAERNKISNPQWQGVGAQLPQNSANNLYSKIVNDYPQARYVDQSSAVLSEVMTGGVDYEKVENARLLQPSEYTLNKHLGYLSLHTKMNTNSVLAIAYEYTYGGQTYQVGEFSSDIKDNDQSLYVKLLKNTSNSPRMGNWDLMMKNVYALRTRSVQRDKFKLDIKYLSDTTGVMLSYIPEGEFKQTTLLRMMNLDRLDDNMKTNPNGKFDFLDGYTVNTQYAKIIFPVVEPFGDWLRDQLGDDVMADRYCYDELYDSTKTVAQQMAEKNKFTMLGEYKGSSANVIDLKRGNIPRGSVVVTAGGVVLTENSDYTVDYSEGYVTITNQSIIDAGTNVNVSLESQDAYDMLRKTMLGVNWNYDFSKNLQFGGTWMKLTEQPLTNKVSMGTEPLNNMIWGLNINWKQNSQWLTNLIDKIPFIEVSQPSSINFSGEFAQLIAGQVKGVQANASYLDDFEATKQENNQGIPTAWMLSSTPSVLEYGTMGNDVRNGYNRARLAWYTIDPLFTRRSSSLTPGHIKSDLDQLSNHYVRAVYVSELYPNRDQSTYSGATSTLPILNVAYYPQERGPYNLNTNVNMDGTLNLPLMNWGGMMRKLDTNDFEQANIEYIEFWLLDPFIYSSQQQDAADYGGDLYINLGEVSEDVLRDGKKFYESGMPVDGSNSFTTTQWGRIPVQATQTYAFATTSGSRALQDVGLNGLNDEQERSYDAYADFLSKVTVNDSVRAAWNNDPANDNYHYFRGSDFDQQQTSILDRYKRINMPQGNSPDSDQRTESYDTSYKTYPDVEDINQDYTLNEYERYYQYKVSIRPEDMQVGRNYITETHDYTASLRNGKKEQVRWYKFRIPLNRYEDRVGGISDFTSIRFMRMFLTQFQKPIVLRFGSLDLVRGEWRLYNQQLTGTSNSGQLEVSPVNIEENNDREPVNYVLPPGISRVTDPSQPQLTEANEQALCLMVKNLSKDESKAIYRNTTLDLRRYKHIQMFVHANHLINDETSLQDDQLAVFVRFGSDYRNNYYEYLIPLKLTPDRNDYNKYNLDDCRTVWPKENMLDIDLSKLTNLKKARNRARAHGTASYTTEFSDYDPDNANNRITILGNPSLGEVKTMMIGVRNIAGGLKSGEVWVNELRLQEVNNNGGWAASGNLNVQLSDVGNVNLTGKIITEGFGGLEEGISQRRTDDYKTYSLTTNFELGKFFPDKMNVTAPIYYSITQEESRPKYNPLDTDLELDEALDAMDTHERDSIESIAVRKSKTTNFSLSNVRIGVKTKRHPMPYDPANFSFSYSHRHTQNSGETTVYERDDEWHGSFSYTYTPVYKTWEPFKNSKSKSKWMAFPKAFGLNYLPQNIGFNTEIRRTYYEMQERDMDNLSGSQLPVTWASSFLWNRDFTLRWDLTKNLHMNFQSGTQAEIEEPDSDLPINKDLYPDRYSAWKDSVWHSIKHFGSPLNYRQTFTASYQVPLNKLPIFDWINADASYNATYNWQRGTVTEKGVDLGNTIANNRQLNINGTLNLETLYNHFPFLKKTNDRFKKAIPKDTKKDKKTTKDKKAADSKKSNDPNNPNDPNKPNDPKKPNGPTKDEKALPKNKNTFQKELTLRTDTTFTITHNKKSKRLIVTAKTKEGRSYPIKYKVVDQNKILVKNLDSVTISVSVTPKPPTENQWWYKPTQSIARFLMMVRSIGISYRNQYSMSMSGYMPKVGDAFGQNRVGGVLAPGLGFAFGMVDDSFIDKAHENGWLNDSISSPAATNLTTDLQLRATLEPVRDLKIDLNASRTESRARSIQYQYQSHPTTQSGTFTMTTISLSSAFESMGDANNGYPSKAFERFCDALPEFQARAAAQYGQEVSQYSAAVMIPAFLDSYTWSGGGNLDFFPALTRLLPNWTFRYAGLAKLHWFSEHFKSFNLNHSYKSVYSVGSYTSDTKTPSLLGWSVPTVSINESFAPLIGFDATLNSGLTLKAEYRKTRTLSLSTTSVQINEGRSNDWVIGLGYKISDFKLFGSGTSRKIKKAQSGNKKNNNASSSSTTGKKSGINQDLNMRLDVTFRDQAAITRDIASRTSSASSGNSALKISFMADYTLSRLLTMSFYYERQTNTPLLSSSSYPTTTRDFGLSMKFSLTR